MKITLGTTKNLGKALNEAGIYVSIWAEEILNKTPVSKKRN